MTRTPETMEIRGSNKFVPGGRVEIGFLAEMVGASFYTMYNHYDTLKIFSFSCFLQFFSDSFLTSSSIFPLYRWDV